jgi:Na+/melibiose symporter-like transporter
MEKERKISVKGDDLRKSNIYSYGIGHFMNDLCASCWFFFLSYFLIEIVKIGEYNTGYVMLAGQVADAIATPLVGIFSDKTNTKIGKRTPWYIGGTILVICSFTLIFVKILPANSSDAVILIYYIVFASLFNIGWAAVQVSHMALVPSLSLNKRNKDLMIRIRTGFTFLAQTVALCISFLFFWLIKDKIFQYELLAGSCTLIGIITSVIFLVLCKEAVLSKNIPLYLNKMRESLRAHTISSSFNTKQNEEKDKADSIKMNSGGEIQQVSITDLEEKQMVWSDWLKNSDFYAYIFVYMFVRLSINVTQSVIPFYMESILNYKKTEGGGTPVEISIVLLISTIGSILNSLFIQEWIEKRIKNSRKKRLFMLAMSALSVTIGCLPMYFLDGTFRYPIYILAFIFGIGFSQGLSTVSSLTNDVVGSKGAQGAFVYGAYSFTDKLSCGIVLALFLPYAKRDAVVLKYSMPIFPPASLICAFIIVYIRGLCTKNKDKEKNRRLLEENDERANKNYNSIIEDPRFTFISNTNNSKLESEQKNKRDNIDDLLF